MNSEIKQEEMIRGEVKFFDSHRGFGFIKTADHGDVYLNGLKLHNCDDNEVHEGSKVKFYIKEGKRGKYAAKVILIAKEEAIAIQKELDEAALNVITDGNIPELYSEYRRLQDLISPHRYNSHVKTEKLRKKADELFDIFNKKRIEWCSRKLERMAKVYEPYLTQPAVVGGAIAFRDIILKQIEKVNKEAYPDKSYYRNHYPSEGGEADMAILANGGWWRAMRTDIETRIDKCKDIDSLNTLIELREAESEAYEHNSKVGSAPFNLTGYEITNKDILQYEKEFKANKEKLSNLWSAFYRKANEVAKQETIEKLTVVKEKFNEPWERKGYNSARRQLDNLYKVRDEFNAYFRLTNLDEIPEDFDTNAYYDEIKKYMNEKLDVATGNASRRIFNMLESIKAEAKDYTQLLDMKLWIEKAASILDNTFSNPYLGYVFSHDPEWKQRLAQEHIELNKKLDAIGKELKAKKAVELKQMLSDMDIPEKIIKMIEKDDFVGFTTPEGALYNLFRYTSRKGIDLEKLMDKDKLQGFLKRMIKSASEKKQQSERNRMHKAMREFMMAHNMHLNEDEMNQYLMKHFDNTICISWTQEHYKPSLERNINKYFRVLDAEKFPGVSKKWEELRIKYSK